MGVPGLFQDRRRGVCCCSTSGQPCCADRPLPPTLCLTLEGTCYPFDEFASPTLSLCLTYQSFFTGPFSPFSGWFGRMTVIGRGGGANDCHVAIWDVFLICWDFGGSVGQQFALVTQTAHPDHGGPSLINNGLLTPLRATSHQCSPPRFVFDFTLAYVDSGDPFRGGFYVPEIDGGAPAAPTSLCAVRAVITACGCPANPLSLLVPDLLLVNPVCVGGPFDGGDTVGPNPGPPPVPADQVRVPCCSVAGVTIPRQLTLAITSIPGTVACGGCLDVIVGATYQNALGAWVANLIVCSQFVTIYLYCVEQFNEFGVLLTCGANYTFGNPQQATGNNCNPLELNFVINIPADPLNPCCPQGGAILLRAFQSAL